MRTNRHHPIRWIIPVAALTVLVMSTARAQSPADHLFADVADECDAVMLTAAGAGPRPARAAQVLEITAIDARGQVTARSLVTGEFVTFTSDPAALARQQLGRGSRIAAGSIPGVSREPRCKCGKRTSGECWCVPDEPACCGPLAGCPIGSCDKKGPVNPSDRPVFETPSPSQR